VPSFIDVLCVGHAAFDLTMAVGHHPGADEKCSAASLLSCGGGPAANAAVTVSRLGGRSAFAGYLGNDLYGRLHYEELQQEGVALEWVVRGDAPTPLSVVLVKPDGLRAVVNHKADTPALPASAVDFSGCAPRAILFDGHEPELSLKLAATARARGVPVLLDAGSVHEGTRAVLAHTDFLVASARFARDFTG
jgi:sulfofructose kinase